MFEQSIILPELTHKRWTFAAGIAMEISAVAVLLLIPLIYTEALGRGQVGPMRIEVPNFKPIVQVSLDKPMPAARSRHPPFRPPTTIIPLSQLLKMKEPEFEPAPGLDCANCVTSNLASANTSTLIGAGDITLPPPAKPPEVQKKPAADPPAIPQRIAVGGSVQEAKIIRRVMPQYPTLAKQARVQGTVRLMSMISKDGTIEGLQVLSGHPLLVAAAVEAVKQWLYRPTLLNGQPVEVQAPIEVHFTLSN